MKRLMHFLFLSGMILTAIISFGAAMAEETVKQKSSEGYEVFDLGHRND
jgi:hypothetical protein